MPAEAPLPSLLDIATGSPDFSILVAAVQYVDATVSGSDLVSALSSPASDLTVFAPDNAAFAQLAADLGYAGSPADTAAVTQFLVDNVPAETLQSVILYHVSAGTQDADTIASGGAVETLNGAQITPDLPTLVDQEPDLIDPSLVATDIAASNGIVHVIDRVLLPIDLPGNDAPTITEIVAASGPGFDENGTDFDLLLAAVTTAGLAEALDEPNAAFTAFAPTDDAFIGLAQALGFDGSGEEAALAYLVEALTLLGGGDPLPLLTEVLTYHVAPESLQASQVRPSQAIPTLQGGRLGVDGAMLVDADPDVQDPAIIATDVQAANGVVHVIDGVLLPADLLQSDGSGDVDFIIAGDGFDFIHTGADNDLIDGNGGSDIIIAGAGDDVMIGGTRSDLLAGGSGSDSFIFAPGDGRDWIVGFESGHDVIDLEAYDFGSYDQLEHAITEYHFRTVVDLGDGDVLTIGHLFGHAPEEADFIF